MWSHLNMLPLRGSCKWCPQVSLGITKVLKDRASVTISVFHRYKSSSSERISIFQRKPGTFSYPVLATDVITIDQTDWLRLYKFNFVLAANLLQRFKIYQTVFFGGFATPFFIYKWLIGEESFDSVIGISTIAIMTCGVMIAFGQMISRVPGIMYTSPHKYPDKLRIARVDFWGHRKDFIYDIEDIIPLSELSYSHRHQYFSLKFYSRSTPQVFFFKRGVIYDMAEFERVWGHVPRALEQTLTVKEDLSAAKHQSEQQEYSRPKREEIDG